MCNVEQEPAIRAARPHFGEDSPLEIPAGGKALLKQGGGRIHGLQQISHFMPQASHGRLGQGLGWTEPRFWRAGHLPPPSPVVWPACRNLCCCGSERPCPS